MPAFDAEVQRTKEYMESPRFAEITRIYSARMVAEQKGTIAQDYTVAREAAEGTVDTAPETPDEPSTGPAA